MGLIFMVFWLVSFFRVLGYGLFLFNLSILLDELKYEENEIEWNKLNMNNCIEN